MLNNYGKKILENLKSNFFLSENGDNGYKLLDFCKQALENLIQNQGGGATFGTTERDKAKDFSNSKIPYEHSFETKKIFSDLHLKMQGSININNPLRVQNLATQPNFVYLATQLATSLYMPNAINKELAGEVLNSELECAAAISDLAGFDKKLSGGVFTFGGTATLLYGVKMGLAKAFPDYVFKGLNSENVVVIGSVAGYYTNRNIVNWLGIGISNYLKVATDANMCIKIDELEKVCRENIESGKKIGCIIVSAGTNPNMEIDDLEKICELRDKLVAEFNLDYVPHIHADAVVGWSYLNFKDYNFTDNKLGLSENAKAKIKNIYEKISNLKFVDSFGVDFHKTGFVPFNSSMIMVKNRNDFGLLSKDMYGLNHYATGEVDYVPWKFTLESSRSGANILATWMTLQTLSQEGFQTLIGNALEMSLIIKEKIKVLIYEGVYLVNENSSGSDVLFRIYPPNVADPESIFKKELTDAELANKYSHYLNSFDTWLNNDYRTSGEKIGIGDVKFVIFTQQGQVMPVMRIAIVNPNVTVESLEYVLRELVTAKNQFDKLVTLIDLKRGR